MTRPTVTQRVHTKEPAAPRESPRTLSGRLRQNPPMATQLSFKLGGSQREWLTLRGSSNPFGGTGGPLPQIMVPLEARVTERGINIEILRLAFDLKIGNTLIGQGEIGPYSYLRTTENYLPATATCPQTA